MRPTVFLVPAVPVVCSCVIFGAFFLIASLGVAAIWRFAVVLVVCTAMYLLYGVHAAQKHDDDMVSYHSRWRFHPELCSACKLCSS